MVTHLMDVCSNVFVLDDDQQSVVGFFLAQKGHGTLSHVTLLQQVLLKNTHACANSTFYIVFFLLITLKSTT